MAGYGRHSRQAHSRLCVGKSRSRRANGAGRFARIVARHGSSAQRRTQEFSMNTSLRILALLMLIGPLRTRANEPVAMYIFPPGGQRGTTVETRVGGLFFHGDAAFA